MTTDNSPLKNYFIKVINHMKWSNDSVINLLEKENINSGKVIELISHILIAEDTWCKRITNESYINQFWNPISLDECRKLAESNNQRLTNFLNLLPENDFQKMIAYKTSKGIDYTTCIEDIFTQIVLHGMYHRGQIMLLMRTLGKDVVATDYAFFVR